jgi:hypothetical protein
MRERRSWGGLNNAFVVKIGGRGIEREEEDIDVNKYNQ